jgi:hypothetical protein
MNGTENAAPIDVAAQIGTPEAGTSTVEQKVHGPTHSVATAIIGGLVTIYAIFDTLLLGLPIIVLAAWIHPLIVFAGAGIVLTIVNRAACGWLDREWDTWMTGSGKRVEKKLDGMRSSRIMKHPVNWIVGGSAIGFAFAASLTNAIITVVSARLVGRKPVGTHRTLVAAVTYSLFFVGTYSLVGWVLGDVIRAL